MNHLPLWAWLAPVPEEGVLMPRFHFILPETVQPQMDWVASKAQVAVIAIHLEVDVMTKPALHAAQSSAPSFGHEATFGTPPWHLHFGPLWRNFAVENFDINFVNAQHLKIYAQLIKNNIRF